jgi:hypothetical protein
MQDLFMYWVNNFPNTPRGYKLDIPQQHLVSTHAETEGNPVRLEELIVWLEDCKFFWWRRVDGKMTGSSTRDDSSQ